MSPSVDRASGPRFVLAAGGTGGHLFPAQALAERLIASGAEVVLATDRRTDAFARAVPGVEIHQVRAGRIGGGPIRAARGVAETAIGIVQARRLLRRLSPDAVVGLWRLYLDPDDAGGDPARRSGHDPRTECRARPRQSAAREPGFAYRDRVRRDRRAAPGRQGARRAYRQSGAAGGARGCRGRVSAAATRRAVEILITGGSQGARIFAEIVPEALAALPPELRGALVVSQQARPEDCDRVAAQLKEAGIEAEISSFFTDIPARLARAQLVICRSGASTIAELAAVGRPALLVPYPHATDDHQTANARAFAVSGAAWVIPQPDFTAPMLTRMLGELLADPRVCGARRHRRGASPRTTRPTGWRGWCWV